MPAVGSDTRPPSLPTFLADAEVAAREEGVLDGRLEAHDAHQLTERRASRRVTPLGARLGELAGRAELSRVVLIGHVETPHSAAADKG